MQKKTTVMLLVTLMLLIASSFSMVSCTTLNSDNFNGSFQSFWGADVGTSPVISGNTMYSVVSLGDGAQSAKTYSGITLGADGTVNIEFDMKANLYSNAGAGTAVEMFCLALDDDSTGTNGYAAVIVDGATKFGLWLGKYPNFVLHYSDFTPVTNNWYHLKLSFDNVNNEIKLDVNGTNVMTEPYALHYDFSSASAISGTFGIVYNYNTQGMNANFDNFKITDGNPESTPTPTATPSATNPPITPVSDNIIVGLVVCFFFVCFSTVFFFFKSCFEIVLMSLLVMAFSIIIGAIIVIPINQIIGIFMIVYTVFVFIINVLRLQM